jgi:2-polyprenyl-3-methyl-5-hydroxy-6-metoxy-1,4-benzoquinol methylase
MEACPICGGKELSSFFTTDPNHEGNFQIVRCHSCGVGMLFPLSDFKEIESKYYNTTYHAYLNKGAEGKSSPVRKIKDSIKNAVLDTYLGYGERSPLGLLSYPFFFRIPFYPERVAGGKYLDVGCGSGVQMLHMKEIGWDVYGVDVSSIALSVARQNGLEHLFQGTLAEAHFPSNTFDAINLTHVLEHIPDPGALLEEIHRILKNNGTLIISVPNFQGLGHRLLERRSFYDVPRHVYQFTLPGLAILLNKSGFIIEKSYRNDIIRGVMSSIHYASGLPDAAEKYFIYSGAMVDLLIEPFLIQTSLGAQIVVKAKKK